MKEARKYSLKPDFLPREFDTIEDLVQYVLDHGIDLSSLSIPVEDFVVAAFEDECVITTSADVSALKS
jgi:hypothetical protein